MALFYRNGWAAWMAIAAQVELAFAVWARAAAPERAHLILRRDRVANIALPRVPDTAAGRNDRAVTVQGKPGLKPTEALALERGVA